MKQAYQEIHTELCACRLHPKIQNLDNKVFTILKEFMTKVDVDLQLVLAHTHRCNAAE